MGTSTARRGPGTALWRLAKGAATRYLAPEGGAPVEAREVLRRYVAALEETQAGQGQDLLAGFRLTRKAAQCLGEFGDQVAESGLAAALEARGLADLSLSPPGVVLPALTSAWLEDHDGLEAAVARTALATCLGRVFMTDPSTMPHIDGPSLVRSFLALVLCQRLALDLGEPLEAAATGWQAYRDGLVRVQEELMAATSEVAADPPGAGQWQGLAGWLFVTKILETVLQRFRDAEPF